MQGTVKTYDTNTRSGSLLTDDRTEIAIDDHSFADPSLRFLRIGQRVRVGNPVTPRFLADVSALTQDRIFHRRDSVCGCGQPAGIFAGKHWKIVEMIACGENPLAPDTELPGNLSQRGSFVISRMTKAGIDIVANHREIRDALSISI